MASIRAPLAPREAEKASLELYLGARLDEYGARLARGGEETEEPFHRMLESAHARLRAAREGIERAPGQEQIDALPPFSAEQGYRALLAQERLVRQGDAAALRVPFAEVVAKHLGVGVPAAPRSFDLGDGDGEWRLGDGDAVSRATRDRLARAGVRPETLSAFRAAPGFFGAAAGDEAGEAGWRLSYGGAETVREFRFVAGELEALAMEQSERRAGRTPAHDRQYVVIRGPLTEAGAAALQEVLEDAVAGVRRCPGVKRVVGRVVTASGPDGAAAQVVADRLCARLGLEVEFSRPLGGSYARRILDEERDWMRQQGHGRGVGMGLAP